MHIRDTNTDTDPDTDSDTDADSDSDTDSEDDVLVYKPSLRTPKRKQHAPLVRQNAMDSEELVKQLKQMQVVIDELQSHCRNLSQDVLKS